MQKPAAVCFSCIPLTPVPLVAVLYEFRCEIERLRESIYNLWSELGE